MATKQEDNEIMALVQKEMDRVDYGKITIIKNKTSEFIDVVTEHRQRVTKVKLDKLKDSSDINRKG